MFRKARIVRLYGPDDWNHSLGTIFSRLRPSSKRGHFAFPPNAKY
ncbi:MAG TPA: hypothetical protein VGI60_06820 [Chthoniobacterales bacterium]